MQISENCVNKPFYYSKLKRPLAHQTLNIGPHFEDASVMELIHNRTQILRVLLLYPVIEIVQCII